MVGIVLFVVLAGSFIGAATQPVAPKRIAIDQDHKSNVRFWIVTWETYQGTLWIGRPPELNPKAFDRLTGCLDFSGTPPQRPAPLQWTIRSAYDSRAVVQGKAIPINPSADDCSSTKGGHVLSLGKLALEPGRYQFDLKLSDEIPDTISFPIELNIQCCGKIAHTRLGGLALFLAFFLLPILIYVVAFLVLILLVRGALFFYATRSQTQRR
jgi:hypothetical protein